MITPRGDGPGETARRTNSDSRPGGQDVDSIRAEDSSTSGSGWDARPAPHAETAPTILDDGEPTAAPPQHPPLTELGLPPLPTGPDVRTDHDGKALVGEDGRARRRLPMSALVLGSIGVVFGDIGTSPLYALQTVFSVHRGAVAPTEQDVLGVVSMVLWCLMLIVSLTYVGLSLIHI